MSGKRHKPEVVSRQPLSFISLVVVSKTSTSLEVHNSCSPASHNTPMLIRVLGNPAITCAIVVAVGNFCHASWHVADEKTWLPLATLTHTGGLPVFLSMHGAF